jgi:Fic family protein
VIDGIRDTAAWTTAKITAIANLFRHTSDHIKVRLPKIHSHELVELIFRLPYCRIGNLVEAGIAQRQTASVYLKQLVQIGVLTEMENGREKLFRHPKLQTLLTANDNAFQPY